MKICNALSKVIEKVCFIGMLLMVGILFAEVIARFVIGKSLYWSNDAAIYLMVANTFFAACVGVSGRNLTRIDFFINKLPERGRLFVEVIDSMLCGACCVFLSVAALPLIESNQGVKMSTLPFDSSLPYWFVLVSSAIMALYYVILAIEDGIRIGMKNKEGDQC